MGLGSGADGTLSRHTEVSWTGGTGSKKRTAGEHSWESLQKRQEQPKGLVSDTQSGGLGVTPERSGFKQSRIGVEPVERTVERGSCSQLGWQDLKRWYWDQ